MKTHGRFLSDVGGHVFQAELELDGNSKMMEGREEFE